MGRVDVTEAADASFLAEQPGAATGQWVDGTGDFDGDGSDDILVGALGWGGANGAAYLLYGGDLPNGTTPVTVAADARLVGERPLSTAGLGIAGGGDLDDDGFDDFVVSAPATPDDSVPGTAYLFYGGPERLTGTMPVGAAADAAIVGEGPGDDAGLGIEIADDLDRDGVDVAALRDDFATYQAVRTYLTSHRDAEYTPPDRDRAADGAKNIQRLRGRTVTVTEAKLEQLRNRDDITLGAFRTLVDITVLCEDCGDQYEVADLLVQGGCDCPASRDT